MNNILAPSILSADFTKLGEQIKACEAGGARYLHVDVMDGIFVPSISIGFPVIETLRPATNLTLDVHLMITNPLRYVERFAKAGSDIITFHQEAAFDVGAVIKAIKGMGKKAGLSVRPHTSLSAIERYLNDIDLLLIMSVEPGFGGQAYIESATEKIREARKMIDATGRAIDLEVDGGIKIDNVEKVTGAGANVIVAGSAVFQGNIEENVRRFLEKM